ncbi:MAG: hypothetical protein ACREQB_03145 [Candidatus Binataceae bacterium]
MTKARLLLSLLALLVGWAIDAHAISLSLQGNGGAGVEPGAAQALYGSDRQGRPTLITYVGAAAPDGSTVTDVGVPAMMPDGRVIFGAETTGSDGALRWSIYYGIPDTPVERRVVEAVNIKNARDDCRPELKNDPYPVADAQGSIAFTARGGPGGDALFLYSHGVFSCLAYPGMKTLEGHEIAILSFGSPQMGIDGEVAFIGYLNADDETPQKKSHRQAILLASQRKGIVALAVEGELGPNRSRYERPLGLPTAVASPEGTMVAFTARTPSGGALFLYRSGAVARILPSGTVTRLGPVSFLSPGRPGLAPDATTAVLAGCARIPAIFKLQRGRLNLSLQRGQITPIGTEVESLSDPIMTAAGAIFVGATDSEREDRLFVLGPDDSFFEIGEPGIIYRIAMSSEGRRHTVFTGTLAVNQHGDFAYLGGK